MHYAKHNGVGTADELPEGAKPISKEQYLEALTKQASGDRVTVIDDEVAYYKPPIYRTDGSKASEYTPGDPLITEAPPEELHVPEWQNGAWAEAETAEQREAREEAEAQAERDRLQSQLDSIDARYHSDRSWREYVIANPDGFAPDAVDRMQAAEDEAAPLRDELAAL